MSKSLYTPMSRDAISEIVESIQAITVKHHGAVDGCLLQIDYASIAMFAFADMATANQQTVAEKQVAYDLLLGNLRRMATRVAEHGVVGLMGGEVR